MEHIDEHPREGAHEIEDGDHDDGLPDRAVEAAEDEHADPGAREQTRIERAERERTGEVQLGDRDGGSAARDEPDERRDEAGERSAPGEESGQHIIADKMKDQVERERENQEEHADAHRVPQGRAQDPVLAVTACLLAELMDAPDLAPVAVLARPGGVELVRRAGVICVRVVRCLPVPVRRFVSVFVSVFVCLRGAAEQPHHEVCQHPEEGTDHELTAEHAEDAPRRKVAAERRGQHDDEHLVRGGEKNGIQGPERDDAPGIQPRGGGGKAGMAQAGAKDASKLEDAFAKAEELIAVQ